MHQQHNGYEYTMDRYYHYKHSYEMSMHSICICSQWYISIVPARGLTIVRAALLRVAPIRVYTAGARVLGATKENSFVNGSPNVFNSKHLGHACTRALPIDEVCLIAYIRMCNEQRLCLSP